MLKIQNFYKVDKDFSDTRLDRYIKIKFSRIPQSLIEKYIRKKKILVNKEKTKSSYKLSIGDEVEIYFNTENKKNLKVEKKIQKTKDLRFLQKKIIFECEDYIILNKPQGIPSQGGSKVKENIIDILNSNDKNFYLVHRLDSDTTGLMIIAKNREFAKKFSFLFQARKIKKKYYAIVNGNINKNKGEIITKEIISGKVIISKTLFKVKSNKKKFSLLDIELVSGRKHQIRKQFFDLNHSIVGDNKYGDKKNNINLCLCSYFLEFKYKNNIKNYKIPLPKFMKNFFYNF